MCKIVLAENTAEISVRLQKEFYNVLVRDKVKATTLELAREDPNYDKILEDAFLTRGGALSQLSGESCDYTSLRP
jgi:hypothetical protein